MKVEAENPAAKKRKTDWVTGLKKMPGDTTLAKDTFLKTLPCYLLVFWVVCWEEKDFYGFLKSKESLKNFGRRFCSTWLCSWNRQRLELSHQLPTQLILCSKHSKHRRWLLQPFPSSRIFLRKLRRCMARSLNVQEFQPLVH